MFERFFWWIGHEPNAPATFVQAMAAVVTTIITGVLCWVTYQYMKLTREMADAAAEQLRASLRPTIAVSLRFYGAQDSMGGEVFKDQLSVSIANKGNVPLVIYEVKVRWPHSTNSGVVSRPVFGFSGCLINPGGHRSGDLHMIVDDLVPTFGNFHTWSDAVQVAVSCSDIGGASFVTYEYTRLDGLRLRPSKYLGFYADKSPAV